MVIRVFLRRSTISALTFRVDLVVFGITSHFTIFFWEILVLRESAWNGYCLIRGRRHREWDVNDRTRMHRRKEELCSVAAWSIHDCILIECAAKLLIGNNRALNSNCTFEPLSFFYDKQELVSKQQVSIANTKTRHWPRREIGSKAK